MEASKPCFNSIIHPPVGREDEPSIMFWLGGGNHEMRNSNMVILIFFPLLPVCFLCPYFLFKTTITHVF